MDVNDSDDDFSDAFNGSQVKFFSIENEVLVWAKVKEEVQRLLNGYPTTYAQDLEILAVEEDDSTLTSNERSCVLFRSGEKKILHFLSDASDKICQLYTLPVKDARKLVNVNSKDYENMGDYIKSTVLLALQERDNKN